MDFSIIIPTYNRSSYLKKAILSVLRQKGVSFEIIVGDNFSTDETEKVVIEFRSKKIKYFKNEKNLGFAGNIRNCFKRAKGKYIFTLGDDDLILDAGTLLEILKTMKRNKCGMGSIGTIYFSDSPKNPCKISSLSDRLLIVKPRKDGRLPQQALNFNISFFTGLIFQRSLININKITDSFNYPYWPFVFDVIQKAGICFIPNYFTLGRISLRFVPQYFDINVLGSFYMEDYLNMMKSFLINEDFRNHKKKFLGESTILLPSIKLYTTYVNYIKVLYRMILLDKSLLINYRFLCFAIVALLPNFILKILRSVMIYLAEKKVRRIVNRYDYYNKISQLGIHSDFFN